MEQTTGFKVFIVVMNYANSTLTEYEATLSSILDEDVEAWLYDNTDYRASDCYYMSSNRYIPLTVNIL